MCFAAAATRDSDSNCYQTEETCPGATEVDCDCSGHMHNGQRHEGFVKQLDIYKYLPSTA